MATEKPFGIVILVILEVLAALVFLGLGSLMIGGGGILGLTEIP